MSVKATLKKPGAGTPAQYTPPTAKPAAQQPAAKTAPTATRTTRKVPTPVPGVEVEAVETVGPSPAQEMLSQAPQQEATPQQAQPEEAPQQEAQTPAPQEEAPQQEAPQQEAQQAVVKAPSQAVTSSVEAYAPNAIEGDMEASDFKLPRLQIVRGNGELTKVFNVGTILLDSVELLAPPDPKKGADENPCLHVIPVHLKKQFQQQLTEEEQKGGVIPQILDSIEEVEDAGGTTSWAVAQQRPDLTRYKPSSRILLMVKRDSETQCEHYAFTQELDGELYAPAVLYAGGGDYNTTAKLIISASRLALVGPVLDINGDPLKDEGGRIIRAPMLWRYHWSFRCTKQQRGDYTVDGAMMKLLQNEETGPEARSFIADLVQSLDRAHIAADGE